MRRVPGGIEGRLGGAAGRLRRRREAARARSLGSRLSQSFTRVAVVSTLCVSVALSRFALAVFYLEPQSNLYAAGRGAADEVHTGMLDQQQGLYGYVASQRGSYFDTFVSRGEAEVTDGDRGLETLASGDPSLRGQVDRVLAAQRQWKDGWASQVVQPAKASASSFSLVTGQSLFSQYLASANDLLRTIDDRSAALAVLSDRSFQAAIAVELALAVLLAAIWTMERRRLRRCIVQPVDGLLSAIEGLRRGEPGPGPAPDAPVEFARIGDELRTTSIALTESRQELEAERAAAAESERRTFQFLDGLPTGVLVLNASGTTVYANGAATELLGEGIAGADPSKVTNLPKPYRAGTEEEYPPEELPAARALAGEASEVGDVEIRHPDRTLRLAVRGTPIRDASGAVLYAVSSFADMTGHLETQRLATEREALERHAAELARSEARFRATFEQAPIGMVTSGLEGRFRRANQAMAELTGYTTAQLEAMGMADIVHPGDQEATARELSGLISGESSSSRWIHRFVRADRHTVWVRTHVSVVSGADDQPYLIFQVEDITALHESEAALRRRAGALERSNRELERFAYVASHDLQEPLRMVASYVQLLEMRYRGRLDRNADDFIGYAVEGAVRMKALLTDLLAFSRIDGESAAVGAVDSRACLRTAEIRLARLVDESRARIEAGHLPAVLAAHDEVCQLFEQLLRNCLTFRGEVTPLVHVGAEAVGDVWQFSVRDNGIGVPPHQRDRVFEVFQRLNTREAYPGTGTGLAMCKKIVEQRGGHIWIEPGDGPGTTVRFTLPMAGGEAGAVASTPQVASGSAARAGRVT